MTDRSNDTPVPFEQLWPRLEDWLSDRTRAIAAELDRAEAAAAGHQPGSPGHNFFGPQVDEARLRLSCLVELVDKMTALAREAGE
jgi:hypothetical protein